MSADPDDALHWDGDEADASIARPSRERWPEPASAQTSSAMPVQAEEAPGQVSAAASEPGDDNGPEGIGNLALVFYGVIGGVYLLFAAGWVVGGFRLRPRASLLLGDWMYFPWMWLAALAPVLWFAASWVLTRGRASWIRIVALIAGAVLLVPWPFVMFGTVGA